MILCCLPALGNFSNQIWNRLTTLIRGRGRQREGGGAKTVKGAAARGPPSIHDWYDVSGQNFGKYPPAGVMGMMTNIHHSPNASPLGSEYDLRILPTSLSKEKKKKKWSGGTEKREKWMNKIQSVNPFVSFSSSSSAAATTPNNLEIGNLNHPQSATNITDLRYQNQENVPAREQMAWMKRNLEEQSARALGVRDAAAAANGRPKWTADTSHVGEFLREGPQVPTAVAVAVKSGKGERESCYVGKGKERAEGHGPL